MLIGGMLQNSGGPFRKSELPATPGTVLQAVDCVRKFAMVGLTDAWSDSVLLFHDVFMPSTPVHPAELMNYHPSVTGETGDARLARRRTEAAVGAQPVARTPPDASTDPESCFPSYLNFRPAGSLANTASDGVDEGGGWALDGADWTALQDDPDQLVYASSWHRSHHHRKRPPQSGWDYLLTTSRDYLSTTS